ncbi:MAG: hypothetical protein WKF37_23105, partial [Bryobacteraceae bacterium]
DRIFGFVAYEGYRESASRRVSGNVPTPAYRAEILRALPFPETKLLLDLLPMPNVPVNPDVGAFEGIQNSVSRENHVTAKTDIYLTPGTNWAITFTRMRPTDSIKLSTQWPNDRTYSYKQNRVSSSFTVAKSTWTAESRFGWNFNDMQRLDQFLNLKDPSGVAERLPWGRSLPRISIAGVSGFGAGSAEIWDMNGTTYTFDQKVSHIMGKHSLKFGGASFNGDSEQPENPGFSFQNKADFIGYPQFRGSLVRITLSTLYERLRPVHSGRLACHTSFGFEPWSSL